MSYFFFISGYLLYRNANQSNLKRKIKSRIYTLLIPYLLWNFISFFTGNWRHLLSVSLNEFLWNIIANPYDVPLWYVLGIFFLLIFFPLCCKWNFLLLFIPAIGRFLLPYLPSGIWWLSNLIDYLPQYCLGGFLASAAPRKERVSGKQSLISLSMTIALSFIYLVFPASQWIRQIILLILPVLLWLCITEEFFQHDPPFPFTISFFLYAMHAGDVILILRSRVMPLFSFMTNSGIGVIVLRMLMFILTYLVILLLTWLAKKTLPAKLFGILSGNRVR